MLIYIIHSDIIYTFRVSNKDSGKYILTDYDDFGNKRNLVNVEYQNGQWYIFGNNDVKISYINEPYENINLNPYNFYTLTILGMETVLLYTYPLYDKTFFLTQITENSDIIVGNNEKAQILYKSSIGTEQVKISYKNGTFSFQNINNKVPVYLNNRNITDANLTNFDTLFIMGLKIIVLGNKLLINNPNNNTVEFKGQMFENATSNYIVPDNKTSVRTFTNFYSDKEYYSKSPVFKTHIRDLNMNIDSPPQKQQRDKSSVLMNVIPQFIMSFSSLVLAFFSISKYKSGQSDGEQLLTELLMVGGLVVASILWPFVEKFYNNLVTIRFNLTRRKKYKKYLKTKEEIFKSAINEQKMVLVVNNVSLSQCRQIVENRTPELFNRDVDNKDFLNIRLGSGKTKLACTINYQKPDFIEDKDELLEEIDKLIEKNKYIDEVPLVVSLFEKNVIAFILTSRKLYADYMGGIILQLLTLHSYYDLKLVVFTSENSEISFLKNSNHCWSNDRSFRYFADNLQEAQQISADLSKIFKNRNNSTDKKKEAPYYMIVSDSIDIYRNLDIIDDILNAEANVGFGLLMYDMKIANIPNNCFNFVDVSEKEGTFFETNNTSEELIHFTPEFLSGENVNADYCSRLISNVPLKHNDVQLGDFPETLGFLEMYGVGNFDQLNIATRWKNSMPYNSLSVPVGVDSNGNLIELDLHEKYHGPHGLIAGTTGSGKSEFIITYILSLAVNFHPDEVQFVLIDYKGGGLAGAFENRKTKIKLPHLVGTITNLDQAEMKRTLVSIKSELQRRQKVFNEAKEFLNTGNIDIYKYQKLYRDGSLKTPMSHLFIICDEFAELKMQQPDFMNELVSAARIGRSLGVHLILSTQKPSGVVDEQIWSNSKFKVCCKVQSIEDSNEMLKKPDAAYIKESGRFYLQIGNDEYFVKGQSAYSGIPYVPSERISTKIDNSIEFISNIGDTYKTVNNQNITVKKTEAKGEELINLLHYIVELANNQKYNYQQLWLDNVPQIIYYDKLINKYGVKPELFNIEPVIGEYDDPENQKQGYVTLPITTGGNVFIAGSSGSGKNTLLSTMIYSTIINHNCDEVNIYIIDLGAEKLNKFQKAPQVGEVLTVDTPTKINYLFYTLQSEQIKRQKYYSQNGREFLQDMKQGKCPFPNILVFIYDIDVFKEMFEDLYDEFLPTFTRNCSKFGINFIITSTLATSLGYRLENNFPQKIALNLLDSSDYSILFDSPPTPNNNPGRGIAQLDKPYEFQVPLIFPEGIADRNLNYVLTQLSRFLKNPAKPVPTIPDTVSVESMIPLKSTIDSVPLGINLVTAQVGYFDFSPLVTLISSSSSKNSINLLSSIINFLSSYDNTNIIVLNALKDTEISTYETVKIYNSNFKSILPVLDKNVDKYNNINDDKKFVIFVLGYKNLQEHMVKLNEEEPGIGTIDDLILKAKGNKNFKFVLFDNISALQAVQNNSVFNLVDFGRGLWIGRGFDSQELFDVPDSYSDNVKQSNDTAVLINNNNANYIKYMKE